MNNEEESMKEFFKKAFNNYINNNNLKFSPEELRKFCIEQLYTTEETSSKKQKQIKELIESFKDKLQDYYGDDKKVQSYLQGMYKLFPNSHVKSWDNFLNSVVNFDNSKNYKSNVFDRQFPIGTISYIGARPGRGKTTALINLALDALRQDKKVVYVTAEETTKQIITRLILSETCSTHITDTRTNAGNFHPRTNLFNYIKDTRKQLPGFTGLINNEDFFGASMQKVQEYITTSRLSIFEAYGASWNDLIDYLNNQEAGTIILVDYIQHLKSPDKLTTQTRQVQLQEISHQLADLAGVKEFIVISGAQFKRQDDNKADMKKDDNFDEASFREAGDLEQDGHILIGIGKSPEADELFYSCMKDREASPDNGKLWKLYKNMGFSFLQGAKDDKGNKIEYIKPKGKNKPSKDEAETDKKKKPNSLADIANGAW